MLMAGPNSQGMALQVLFTGTFAAGGRFALVSLETKTEMALTNRPFGRKRKGTQTVKREREILTRAAFAIFAAGYAAEHHPMAPQAGLAQSEASKYVAAMSEQPGQLALKHQCGHDFPGLVSRA
jgi:hypothetical protein